MIADWAKPAIFEILRAGILIKYSRIQRLKGFYVEPGTGKGAS
jgi:hypothetical protein